MTKLDIVVAVLATIAGLFVLFFVVYVFSRVQMAGWLSVVDEFLKKHQQEPRHEEKHK